MVASRRAILGSRSSIVMRQFISFFLVGIFNTLFGYAVIFLGMYGLGLSAITSNVLGYTLGLFISYSLNRVFTFKDSSKSAGEALRFLVVFAAAYCLNLACLIVLIDEFKIHEGVSQVLAGVVYVFSAFVLNKYYVFRVKHGSNSVSLW